MNRLLDLKTQLDGLVLVQLPTAFPEAIDADVNEVIRMFFEKTGVWRVELGPYARHEGSDYVVLTPPVGTAVGQVYAVKYDGGELPLRDGRASDWVWGLDRPDLLMLPDGENDDGGMHWSVEASLIPMFPDTIMPSTAITHHMDTLVAGCLWRLYNQHTKPWFNAGSAANEFRTWRKGLANARVVGLRGYAPTPLRAYNPYGSFA